MSKIISFLKFIFHISILLLIVISLFPGSLAGLVFYGDPSHQPNLIKNPFGTTINHFIYYFYDMFITKWGDCPNGIFDPWAWWNTWPGRGQKFFRRRRKEYFRKIRTFIFPLEPRASTHFFSNVFWHNLDAIRQFCAPLCTAIIIFRGESSYDSP